MAKWSFSKRKKQKIHFVPLRNSESITNISHSKPVTVLGSKNPIRFGFWSLLPIATQQVYHGLVGPPVELDPGCACLTVLYLGGGCAIWLPDPGPDRLVHDNWSPENSYLSQLTTQTSGFPDKSQLPHFTLKIYILMTCH